MRDARRGAATAFFDPENAGGDTAVDGLRIRGNEITGCIARDEQRRPTDPPIASIALGRVYDIDVRDNRIVDNGTETSEPCCGVFVRHSRGARVEGNTIERNGHRRDERTPLGVQGGVVLPDVRASVAGVLLPGQEAVGFVDLNALGAAQVTGNTVSASIGLALRIEGQGPMRITGNRFQSRDVLGRAHTDDAESPFGAIAAYVGTVFVLNLGVPSGSARSCSRPRSASIWSRPG